jgi:hypothetical protein
MRAAKLAVAAALCSAAVAFSQGGPPGGAFGGRGGFGPGPGPWMHEGGKVITGVPYSATATNLRSEKLEDGNTIQRTTTETVARDSAGRTYTMQTMPAGPMSDTSSSRTIIFIADPVAGVSYVLDPAKKTAMKRTLPAHDGPRPDGAGRQRPENPNMEVSTTQGVDPVNSLASEIKTIKHTIPAGKIGNAQPIVSTSSVYYSTALQTVVYATRTDPRSGSSTFSLANIVTGDQSAAAVGAFFTPPADYTVTDAPSHRGPGRGFGPPPPPQE